MDLPQSRIACFLPICFRSTLNMSTNRTIITMEANASGAGAHHENTMHRVVSNIRMGPRESRPSKLHNGSRIDVPVNSQRVP